MLFRKSLTIIYPLSIIAVLTITPLLFHDGMMRPFHAPKELFLQVMVFLLISIRLIRAGFSFRWNILDLFVLFRFVLILIFYFISKNYHNLFLHIDVLFYITLFYFLIQSLKKDEIRPIQNIGLTFIFITAFLEALYGVLQFFNVDFFHPEGYTYFESKVIGTFGNANFLSGFLAAVFPLNLFVFIHQKKNLLKWLCGAVCVIILFAIVLTKSRGAWIALLSGFFVFTFPLIQKIWKKLSIRGFVKPAVAILLCLILILCLWGFFLVNPDSATGRFFIWKVSWQMIKEFPILGIGYGNYGVEYLNYQAKFFENPENQIYFDRAANIKQAHNEFIHVWAETGLIGLIMLSGVLVFFYLTLFSTLKCTREQEKWVILAFAGSVTAVAAHSIVESPLFSLPISLIFYFCIGFVSLRLKETGSESENLITGFSMQPVMRSRIYTRPVLFALSLILVFYTIYGVSGKASGYIHWGNGQDAIASGNWGKGISEYKKALEYLPDKAELLFHLGAAYAYTGRYSRERSEKAVELLELSLSDFNDKNTYLCLGTAYKNLGRHDKAEQSFKTVLKMYPKLLLPRLWLADMYYHGKRKEDAITELKTILKTEPKVLSDEAKNIKKEAAVLLELYLSEEL